MRVTGIMVGLLLAVSLFVPAALAGSPPGTDTEGIGPSEVTFGSILPVVTETGFISLSVDGVGTNDPAGGLVYVDKPAGATVRSAYAAAASTGYSTRMLADGDVKLDGSDVAWHISTPSSISSWNHWADVTALVKPKIDAAAAGLVGFMVTEVSTSGIDGVILAVIFDDPNQTVSNTVILLFGAQDVLGDTFNINLADPIDKSDPNLVIDMGLGISFGFQPGNQVSHVDVNGERLTSSAGGQDDGESDNGTLITVGGIGDSNDNPPPLASPTGPNDPDDEMYNLLPFVDDGDTAITVFTINPSNDDNIFFAWLYLQSVTAGIGEIILLSPAAATNQVGETHTVTATVNDDDGSPIEGRTVDFEVISGPHAGLTGSSNTGPDGTATFSYTGSSVGTDTIVARMVDGQEQTITSNAVTKEWASVAVGGTAYPVSRSAILIVWIVLGAVIFTGAGFLVLRRRPA